MMTPTDTKIETPVPEAAHALLRRLATCAMGLTGADVERIVRQARLKARREKRSIRYEDLEAGIRMDRPDLPHDLRWHFAVHEAGHAVVHHALRLGPIHGLTIDTLGGGGHSLLGFTASGSDTLGYREDVLAMLMAGRAAEQIVVGSVSAGSGGTDDSDLARATRLALAMERTLGFGGVHPLLYRDDKDPTAVLDAHPGLETRVHGLLERAQARAVDILQDHCGTLDRLTQALFDAQALDEDAVKQLLKRRDLTAGSG
ncbi:cell division protease FtsH [Neorhizobium galegae]|uniref:ATP-dependent Zn protease n=1 Tax=Neorhizobium galegae TaxID=399 RepID=UPI001AE10052|nr:ATP-dependent Zn protease [Neorhizobium galegae]MBP2547915.1 cell division protease FtsH [Neorhizobium galegae]